MTRLPPARCYSRCSFLLRVVKPVSWWCACTCLRQITGRLVVCLLLGNGKEFIQVLMGILPELSGLSIVPPSKQSKRLTKHIGAMTEMMQNFWFSFAKKIVPYHSAKTASLCMQNNYGYEYGKFQVIVRCPKENIIYSGSDKLFWEIGASHLIERYGYYFMAHSVR